MTPMRAIRLFLLPTFVLLVASCSGSVDEQNPPDKLCEGVSCSGHGQCVVDDDSQLASCQCDAGYSSDGLSCIEDGCVPVSHASSTCDSGDIYWFDSCGYREEIKDHCAEQACLPGQILCPDPDDPVSLWIEAEEASLIVAPFSIALDPDASKGRYVVASGVPDTSDPVVGVSHGVSLPSAGDWYLWARLYAPSDTQDAIYLGFDGLFTRVFPHVQGQYSWVSLPGGQALDLGAHELNVGHGEAGVYVDAFVVTDDPLFVPAAIAEPACGNGWVETPETCEAPDPCCRAAGCTLETECLPDDGCCPSGCTSGNDDDCGAQPSVVLSVLKAFPDLWGEGADNIVGGRGGIKFFITSLADTDTATHVPASGNVEEHYEGTLRGALALAQPRQIIPRVSGNIDLNSTLRFSGATRGRLTYHGHLAPQGGLSVTNEAIILSDCDDVVFRHLRLRFGVGSELDVDDTMTLLRINRLVVDHASLAWGADETFSVKTTFDATYDDIIVQNTIIGQSKDGHNTGTLIGWTDPGDNTHGVVSWHNNVYVGVTHRTPNIAGDTELYGRIYNNIAYDWQWRLTNVVGAPTVDVAYNYYKMGPANPNVPIANYNQYQDLQGSRPYPPSIFTAGNIMPGVLTDPAADNQVLWTYFGSSDAVSGSLFRGTRLPIDPIVGYLPSSAEEAYARLVLAKEVGANRSTDAGGLAVVGLDSVDDNYLVSIANGTNPRSTEASWVHPQVPDSTPYTDDNWNGIPDAFEALHGIASSDQVIVDWDFGDYRVVNQAGYDAFEIYSAWVAGDLHRLAP